MDNEFDDLGDDLDDDLDGLVSPDDVEVKFDLEEDVQRHILGMLLTDRSFLVQGQSLIKATYFHNLAHQKIYNALTSHFDRYQSMPHEYYLQQELNRHARDDGQKIFFMGELDAVMECYIPGIQHRQFLLDEITSFAKTQALRLAFYECKKIVDHDPRSRETWSRVDEILRKARTIENIENLGLEYFQTIDERYEMMGEEIVNAERFTSGFPTIDHAISGGGLSRGEIGAWMGIPGVGKSLALVKGAVANMKLGKRVLYISLEMDEPKIATRFDAQLARQNISKLYENKEHVIPALKDWVREYEDQRMLVIKQFPAATADMSTIKAYHQQLKLHGFKPDLVIIDYVGEMKDIAGMAIHDSREQTIKLMRSFGVEEGHCTLTAVQPNRQAKAASEDIKSFIDDQQVGDSYNQFRPLDAFWTINQNQQEKDIGLARIYIAKHRNGESRFGFHIGYDYDVDKCLPDGVGSLDMFEISKNMYFDKWNEQVERDAQGTQMDNVKVKNQGPRNSPKNFSDFDPDPDLGNIPTEQLLKTMFDKNKDKE